MHLEAQSVPERMAESVAESPGRDHVAGQRVAFTAGHAGAGGARAPCAARVSNQLVNRPLPLVGPGPDHHGAGQIGAVPVHLGAEVKQQPVSGFDTVRWLVRAWGRRTAGPDATMVGNGCHSLPRRRRARLQVCPDLEFGLAHPNATAAPQLAPLAPARPRR